MDCQCGMKAHRSWNRLSRKAKKRVIQQVHRPCIVEVSP